uniref:Uncharacterized protein n=1 Tax=Musa acuminata subsp. malaccensis TaxID=214687 RepID=A0A804J8M7_MUSAM
MNVVALVFFFFCMCYWFLVYILYTSLESVIKHMTCHFGTS